MQEVKIVMMNPDELKPYQNNPRSNEAAVQYVANSIEQFGFKVPIVVDQNHVIIAGHTRYLAAKQLGMEAVPVIVANDLTEDQVKAFRIADNKTAEQSEWNMLKLSKEIFDIDVDLTEFGFSDIEIDNLTGLANDFFVGPSYSYDDDVQPGVFSPNTTPMESSALVSDRQMEQAQQRQMTRFSQQAVQPHNIVVCPHCGMEFEID